MSVRRKRRKDDAPLPATGAGLLRFYSEADSPGIKMSPRAVIVLSILLIGVVLGLQLVNAISRAFNL